MKILKGKTKLIVIIGAVIVALGILLGGAGIATAIAVNNYNKRPEVKFKKELAGFAATALSREEFSGLKYVGANLNELLIAYELEATIVVNDVVNPNKTELLKLGGDIYVNEETRELMFKNAHFREDGDTHYFDLYDSPDEFYLSSQYFGGSFGMRKGSVLSDFESSAAYSYSEVSKNRERFSEFFRMIDEGYSDKLDADSTRIYNEISDLIKRTIINYGHFSTYTESYGSGKSSIEAEVHELKIDTECLLYFLNNELYGYLSREDVTQTLIYHIEKYNFIYEEDGNATEMYDKFLNETLVDAIDEIRESPNDYMTLRLRKNAQTGEAFMLELASYDEDKEEEEGEQQETEGIEKNEKGEEIVISIRLESYANPESRDVRIMLGATRIYYQVNESNEEIYRSTLKIDGKTYFTMNVSRIHSTYNMAIYDGREGKIFQLSGKWNFTEEEQTVSIDTLHHNGVELLFSASVTLKKAEMPQKSEYRNSIFDMKYDYLDEYLFNYLEAKKKENENPIRDWYDRINGKI